MTETMATAGLRSKVVRGLAWKVVSQVYGLAWHTAVAITLARLLTPGDYGLAAMVIVFAAIVPVFSDLALGSALVQRRELSEADRSTVFWVSTGIGAGFTLVGIALSWPLAAFYGEPEVQPLFAALSLTFVVTALGTTQRALLTRDMNFKSLELRIMLGTLVSGSSGIALAATGFGAWAIVGQQIILATVSTVLLWRFSTWRPRFLFSRDSFRRLAGFGLNVFGTRILFYGNRNADNLLVGRVLGAGPLGVYALSYNIMLAPLSRLGWPIGEVLYPAFSRLQDDPERTAQAWVRINRLVGAITIPATLGLIVVAPEFVTVVLGERWREAEPVIRLLAWVGLLQSLGTLNSAILRARDRTGTLLRYAAIALVASLVGFTVGLEWGIVGVAAGYAVSSTFVEPLYAWFTARALGISPLALPRGLRGVFEAAGAMAGLLLATKVGLLPGDLHAAWRFVVLILLGFALYVPLIAWRAPEVLAELKDIRRSRVAKVTAVPKAQSA
jgi:O-antigen/teichoic acid export membrane protein